MNPMRVQKYTYPIHLISLTWKVEGFAIVYRTHRDFENSYAVCGCVIGAAILGRST